MICDVLEMDQRTPEWFEARLGRATGSKAAAIVAKGRGKDEAVTRRDYRIQLALERITNRCAEDGFVTKEMQRGTELEPAALAAYEALTGNIAITVGFYQARDLMAGCSPDGVVNSGEGIVSLKCPKSSTHIANLSAGSMPPEYVPQMLHELWLTGARWYDFVSFDDRMPEELQTFVVRVARDEQAIDVYATEVRKFLAEVDAEVSKIQALCRARKAAA